MNAVEMTKLAATLKKWQRVQTVYGDWVTVHHTFGYMVHTTGGQWIHVTKLMVSMAK